ncbi:hypothetical protein BC835DRAFT_1335777 [Cytidiella melzeri]|nr:hypothetical protein BC835DRAFT_1335777 [Cytidiella melzeri]
MNVHWQSRNANLEDFWNNRYDMFKARGYLLCFRDCPGCEAISLEPGIVSLGQPSSLPDSTTRQMVVATHVLDGRLVSIKRLETRRSDEIWNIRRLRGDYLDALPANRCTRVLELFEDDTDRTFSFAVMPFLRAISPADFRNVGDVVDFISQILLGIAFMHIHDIAHRDCSLHNILTDADVERLHHLHRREVESALRPMRYEVPLCLPPADPTRPSQYYISNLAFSFRRDPYIDDTRASGRYSRDLDPPEYYGCPGTRSNGSPGMMTMVQEYDPFYLDVFLVGNMIHREFLTKYSNIEFCRELADLMTQQAPLFRPDAEECFEEWCSVIPQISSSRTRRLRPREESRIRSLVFEVSSLKFFMWSAKAWARARSRLLSLGGASESRGPFWTASATAWNDMECVFMMGFYEHQRREGRIMVTYTRRSNACGCNGQPHKTAMFIQARRKLVDYDRQDFYGCAPKVASVGVRAAMRRLSRRALRY